MTPCSVSSQQARRIISAPFSPLGHDTHIASRNATCVALPTTQPVAPAKNTGELMRTVNQEQPFHPIYNYAAITDAEEGLILVDVNTLQALVRDHQRPAPADLLAQQRHRKRRDEKRSGKADRHHVGELHVGE